MATGESKSERRRRSILDAAAYLLSTKGYAALRLSDVAEEAGIRAPALYYYFSSKDELVEEVVCTGIGDVREHVSTAVAEASADATPMDRIMIAVDVHLRHTLAISDYTTAAIRNAGHVPERVRARQKAEEGRYGQVWAALIADAVAAKQVRKELDPRIARMLVLGALNWPVEWWNPRQGSLERVVRNAQSIIRSGLGVARK